MITKQREGREKTHVVCLHAVAKHRKVESVNMQND